MLSNYDSWFIVMKKRLNSLVMTDVANWKLTMFKFHKSLFLSFINGQFSIAI